MSELSDNVMFDEPPVSNIYSMDNVDLYGEGAYYLSYREAVNKGAIADFKIHLVRIKDQDLIDIMESSDDVELKSSSGGEDVILKTNGEKILGASTIAARRWLRDAVESGITRKVLAFFNRIAYCERAIDPSHPLSLVGEEMATYSFHSKHSSLERLRRRNSFGNHEGYAMMASVKAIREGIDIQDADTAILLRGYGSTGDTGASIELVQHIGRIVRKHERKKYANILIPFPDVEIAADIRERLINLTMSLLESLDVMPAMIQILESGRSITPGDLRKNNINIESDSNEIYEDKMTKAIEFQVLSYVKEYNRPLWNRITSQDFDDFLDEVWGK